jgi:hypothetical protein
MIKQESDFNSEGMDVCIDNMFDYIDKLNFFVGQLEPSNVPQTAARDKMQEILDRALKPYMAEFAQCSDVFEQGV